MGLEDPNLGNNNTEKEFLGERERQSCRGGLSIRKR